MRNRGLGVLALMIGCGPVTGPPAAGGSAPGVGAPAGGETLDMATFTGPSGWQRQADKDVVQFGTGDQATGTYGVVTVFVSQPSTGDPASDFGSAWAVLVPGVAAPTPNIGATTQGEQLVQGGAQTTDGQFTGVTVVAVIRAHGRYVPILAKTNSQEHMVRVNAFLLAVQMAPPGGGGAPEPTPTPTPVPTPVPTSPQVASAADIGDITYAVPDGWTATKIGGGVVRLTAPATGGCMLDILGFRPSGASVAADAEAVFKTIFAGWDNGNEALRTPYTRITTGVSADGWEYAQLRSFLEQGQTKIMGMVFLVRLGNRTAVMAAARPGTEMNATVNAATNTLVCLDEYMSPDWGQFFHGLRFAGWTPAPGVLAKQLIGSWYASSISVGLVYIFAANGRFDFANGYETSKRVAPELLEKTIHGFAGSGAYKLTGNRVDMTSDGGKRETVLVRWERTAEGHNSPEEFIRMLTTDGKGKPIEVRYRRSN